MAVVSKQRKNQNNLGRTINNGKTKGFVRRPLLSNQNDLSLFDTSITVWIGVKVELIKALSIKIKLVKFQFRFNFGLILAKVYLIRPVRTLIDFKSSSNLKS